MVAGGQDSATGSPEIPDISPELGSSEPAQLRAPLSFLLSAVEEEVLVITSRDFL